MEMVESTSSSSAANVGKRLDPESREARYAISASMRSSQLNSDKKQFFISVFTLLVALVALAVAIASAVTSGGNSAEKAKLSAEVERKYSEIREKLPLHFNQLVDIPTIGTRDSEWFSVDGTLYLVFASDKDDSKAKNVNSQIWRFNREDRTFVLHQNIQVYSAHDVDTMVIAGDTYLTLGSKNGKTHLYKYDKTSKMFSVYQAIDEEKKFIRDIDHFVHDGADWMILTVSERENDQGVVVNDANSELWKWNTGKKKFEFFQNLPSMGARDSEFFVVEGVACIAIANTKGNDPSGNKKYPRILDSYVYKWDTTSKKFVPSDPIPNTEGNYDFKYFELETRCLEQVDANTTRIKVTNSSFLASAFSTNGSKIEINSPVYRWHGWGTNGGWKVHQQIPGMGSRDVEFFQMPSQVLEPATTGDESKIGFVAKSKDCPRAAGNQHNTMEYRNCINSFLAIANLEHDNKKDNDIHSAIYVWSMWQNKFIPLQAMPTFGVRDIAYVYDKESNSHMLSTASSKESSSKYNTRSFVLSTLGLRIPQLEKEALEKHNTAEIMPCD